MTRFFAGWTLTALLGSCLLYGALTTLDGRFKVEKARSQETRLGESYRTASETHNEIAMKEGQ